MPPLAPGSKVLIQNQYGAGKIAKKWDKSGTILEDLGFNKYAVKVDGSGRITQRNRQFLKKFTPVTPSLPGPNPNSSYLEPQFARPELNPNPAGNSQSYPPVVEPIPTPDLPNLALSPPASPSPQFSEPPSTPESPTFVTPPSSPSRTPNLSEPVGNQPILPETPKVPGTVPRRSTRVNLGQPPDRLTYSKF